MMFRVCLVRKLFDVQGVSRRQISDTFSTSVLKSVQFLRVPLVLLGNALVPETADIQPNSVAGRKLTRLASYFQGSHKKCVVVPGKLGAPKDPAVLDKSPETAYEYVVDLFPCTIAIGILTPAVQVRPLKPRSSYPQSPPFRKVKEHRGGFIS